MDRRRFLGSTAMAAVAAGSVKKRRTMYFNDARHFYLYSFEPPMNMEDAWRPVDELAGTAVNTLIYGVETGGLFAKTKVADRAFASGRPFTSALAWRAWYNMQALIDRGLDPLQVLVDRAHDRGLDFFTSMRMSGGPKDPRFLIAPPGGGPGGGVTDFAHPEVRAARFSWLEELAAYPVEGIELDFAYVPYYFKPDQARAQAHIMSDYVRDIGQMARGKGKNRVVGARVFPTVELNMALGLDVKTWLAKRYVDYVAPMFYGFHQLDPNLPFESIVTAARGTGAEVYPVIQPFYLRQEEHASPAMLRAAISNFWAKGADGLIVGPWFRWPHRDAERSFLTDIGDPVAVRDRDKHYMVAQREPEAAGLGYDQPLPLKLERADPAIEKEIPIYIADDASAKRVRSVRLLIKVMNLVTADTLQVMLNGAALEHETVRRTSHRYEFQWLDYTLGRVRPKQGVNTVAVCLAKRPEGLEGGVTIEQVEVIIEYGLPRSVFERPPAEL